MDNWNELIKPTKSRKIVYEIIKNANKPLSASSIFELVKKDNPDIWLSTIYRTLDVFVKHNIFIKFDMIINNEPISIYKLNDQKHTHFAICSNCNKLLSVINCPLENYNLVLEEANFKITSHKMEIYGLCKNCQ